MENSTLLTFVSLLVATSSYAQKKYEMGNPNNPNYAYLQDYAPLKNYIDTDRYPNFKLGIGTTVNDYLNNTLTRGLTDDNFTETVAGNAMKMASCVDDNGNMNFTSVRNYVNTATSAGLNIYGHTLGWHAQQPTGWLNGLIKDRPAVPFEHPDTMVSVVVKSKDFRKEQSVGWTSDKSQYGFSLNFSATDGLNIHTTKKCTNSWDVQFIGFDNLPVLQGVTYDVTYSIKGSKAGKLHTKFSDWGAGPGGDVAFTTEWQEVTLPYKLTVNNAFLLLQCGDYVGDIYIRDIAVKESVGAMKVYNGDTFTLQLPQSTPLTPEQKHDTLVWAMDKWIKGMMDACGGKVKAWDVVNEAISGGGNDGSGNYTLQHGNGSGDFFWQDHMGDLEYVRQAIRLARQYGPEDIKLFINDYNLESDWDGNKKLKSLINWIKKWESDGVTHVDGIGTQMHISCYMNGNTMSSKKNAITNMFKLMAASGKLVRVSELDMGMVDAKGSDVPTSEMTEDMHQKMADFYEWIVKQYLTLIPADQQWGICFWCPTDAPVNSGWRAGSPIGIWTLDMYRKHVYAGIAKGLGGIDVTGIDDIKSSDDGMSDSHTEAPIYSISGIRMPSGMSLSSLPAGVYIIGGKKVVKR